MKLLDFLFFLNVKWEGIYIYITIARVDYVYTVSYTHLDVYKRQGSLWVYAYVSVGFYDVT